LRLPNEESKTTNHKKIFSDTIQYKEQILSLLKATTMSKFQELVENIKGTKPQKESVK